MEDVSLETLYDALHDPDYRKVWDKDMADSYDICKLNDNTVIGWYAGKKCFLSLSFYSLLNISIEIIIRLIS